MVASVNPGSMSLRKTFLHRGIQMSLFAVLMKFPHCCHLTDIKVKIVFIYEYNTIFQNLPLTRKSNFGKS